MASLEFHTPYFLLLLPLALLPLLPNQNDFLPFPRISLIPVDTIGKQLHRLWQCVAVLTIAFLVIGLSGPKSSDRMIERVGRGAEISILLDRSASMDGMVRRPMPKDYQPTQKQMTKNDIAREALGWLLDQRPENRYSLLLFSVVPMRVTDFTDDTRLLHAGLDASGIGRGPKETNMGSALLSAIEGFDKRPYTGSRALLLVSDGGAKLDDKTRSLIKTGLQRNKISLYFIYVQSGINAPNFELVGTDMSERSEEIELHVFFSELGTAYQVFQADDVTSMSEAVAIIDSQQNLPLTFFERTPGIDYSRLLYLAALVCCAILAIIATIRLEKFE